MTKNLHLTETEHLCCTMHVLTGSVVRNNIILLLLFTSATAFGKGVYFARDWTYSAHHKYSPPNKQGFKFIYQARVLSGEFGLGREEDIDVPLKPNETTKRYDSVVDNVKDPSIFVVFRDTQVYPEYLITFM